MDLWSDDQVGCEEKRSGSFVSLSRVWDRLNLARLCQRGLGARPFRTVRNHQSRGASVGPVDSPDHAHIGASGVEVVRCIEEDSFHPCKLATCHKQAKFAMVGDGETGSISGVMTLAADLIGYGRIRRRRKSSVK